jgi:hypothetical protein
VSADVVARRYPGIQMPLFRAGASIQERFEQFDRLNPHIYELLVELARLLRARRPRRRVGIGMLYEVLRWNYLVHTTGGDFKLNNNFRSRYARLIEHREADLRGAFELRELQS